MDYHRKTGEETLKNDGTAVSSSAQGQPAMNGGLTATTYNSQFPLSHDTYNGIFGASDGKIYYVLCSESIEEGGKMYCFDPVTGKISLCGDLTEVCGEKERKSIPQGKSHVTFIEVDGKLFFSTHVGYYHLVDGMDRMGVPPAGYSAYPGGHILSYDLATKTFEDYAIVPNNEGVLTMNMDTRRGLIYGITWPTGRFFQYNLHHGSFQHMGPISAGGENGSGNNFRALCRSIAINPADGSAFYSTSEGSIFRYNLEKNAIELVSKEGLKKDYFGHYDPAAPGHMGYNWRQVFWHHQHQCIYGVHGNSGYLFRYHPAKNSVDILDRITSKPSQRSGMYDQFSYGYLGLMLGQDGETLYYLTGSPMYLNGKRIEGKSTTGKGEAKGLENLHLITYQIEKTRYVDHGPIYFKDGQVPLYVNSIAMDRPENHIYFLGRITDELKTRTDLISIPNPLTSQSPKS